VCAAWDRRVGTTTGPGRDRVCEQESFICGIVVTHELRLDRRIRLTSWVEASAFVIARRVTSWGD